MAHPKRRKSKSKSRKHRTHYKVRKPGTSYDSREDEFHLPHRVGPSGTYKGVQYLPSEE
jgi:ribosomal protein L32